MKNFLYPIVGRSSLIFDFFLKLTAKSRKEKSQYDKTGILFEIPQKVNILHKDNECIFVDYNRLSHSFWRAQEFSLYEKYKDFIKRPLMDFGCGDGSFASVLFDGIEYGVDNDQEALSIAAKLKIYQKLIQNRGTQMSIENGSVSTIISNSVLEHVVEPDNTFSQLYKILKKDGNLIFTVPTTYFTEHLKKYFGYKESMKINSESYHYNMFSKIQWEELIKKHGFSILKVVEYQPDWFTFYYRMLRLIGRRGIGRIVPDINRKVWDIAKNRLVNMVKKSISETNSGANIFVIAKKQ